MTTNINSGGSPNAFNPNVHHAENAAVAFVSALHNGHDGDIPYDINGEIVRSGNPEFIKQHEGELRVCAGDQEQSYFVFGVLENSERDAWDDCKATPTAAIYKNGISIFCWAFETPVQADDPKIVALMDHFEMVSVDEAVPLPGTDGWELAHADPTALYTVDAFAETYLPDTMNRPEAIPEADPYHGAHFPKPFDESKYDGCTLWVATGKSKFEREWKPGEISIVAAVRGLTNHVVGKKDGLAVVYGQMDMGRRLKKAIRACTAIPLDYDTGIRSADLDAVLAQLGILCVRYTSHSHWKTSTDISLSEVRKFGGEDCEITSDLMRRYLRQEKHWEEWIVETVDSAEESHTVDGFVVRVGHAPMPKHRVIVFLREPFVMRDVSSDHREAMAIWGKIMEAFAAKIGFRFDRACMDPSHTFFQPRHDKNRPHEVTVHTGELFDWRSLNVGSDDSYESLNKEFENKGGNNSATDGGQKLRKWAVHRARGFDIENVIEDHDSGKIRGDATEGQTIECPFDSGHSNPGATTDTACYAVNAGVGGSFIIRCRHGSCQNYTNLDMLGKMIEDDWFPESVLWDEQYNSVELTEEEASLGKPESVLEEEILPTLGEMRDRIANLKESEDQHGDLLKIVDDIIRAGFDPIQVGDLKTKIREALGTKDKQPLNDLFKERKSESKKKKASGSTGPEAKFWFYDESKIAKAMDATKLAVVRLGAQRRFVFFDHNDIPQFLLKSDAEIEFAQYRYFQESGGSSKDGFTVWLESPYRFPGYDEVVFQPGDKPVPENVLNLWRGWGVEPKKGDWSKFKDHIKTIVCNGDESSFKFYMAFWAQMIQDPTTKPGVAPVAKGKKGSGKSIVPYYVRKLIPKNSKVVDKPKSWLGQYNAGLAHCLLLCVEEAMFAGNHEHDSAMKNLITSDTLEYEAKYVNAIQGPNSTHVHITSNEDWVVPATPGERRYLVLKVSPARVGDYEYFKAIADEMENGGCEAFLYDMLCWDYSDVNLRDAPETEGLREQILTGLDPKLKWLASVLEDGAFPFKDGRGPDVTDWFDVNSIAGSRKYAADCQEYEIGEFGGTVPKRIVYGSYRDFCPGFRQPDTDEAIATFLSGLGLELDGKKRMTTETGERPRAYAFPPLEKMREAFLELVPTYKFKE